MDIICFIQTVRQLQFSLFIIVIFGGRMLEKWYWYIDGIELRIPSFPLFSFETLPSIPFLPQNSIFGFLWVVNENVFDWILFEVLAANYVIFGAVILFWTECDNVNWCCCSGLFSILAASVSCFSTYCRVSFWCLKEDFWYCNL